MSQRIRRERMLNAEEVARVRQARGEFADRPSRANLLATDRAAGPMNIEVYLAWRKGFISTLSATSPSPNSSP